MSTLSPRGFLAASTAALASAHLPRVAMALAAALLALLSGNEKGRWDGFRNGL